VNIHQMQMRYDPTADRLLWQLRTFGGELFAVWLTRRMLRGIWAPTQDMVTRGSMAKLMPHATVMPEAREMMSQVVRQRPLPSAQFDQPFNNTAASQPLGTEPLLPVTFRLGPGPTPGGLLMELKEEAGRNLSVQMSDELATALLRLIDQALVEADWGLAAAAPAQPAAAGPVTLN
jgi:hypothetical protein